MKKILLSLSAVAILFAHKALAECSINGEVVPCDQIPKWPFLIVIAVFVLGMGSLIFWVMMLVDIAKNEKDKDLIVWLLLLFFFGIVGAVVYYFAVKLPRKKKQITDKK